MKFTQENNPRQDGMAHEIRRCDIPIPTDIIDLPGRFYRLRNKVRRGSK